MKTNINQIFQNRKNDSLFNTSYPLRPDDWYEYLAEDIPLPFPSIKTAFYIHIPFCKRLCSFCEYAKIPLPNIVWQRRYIDTLKADISRFLAQSTPILYGFDIGGGTPTALDDEPFGALLDLYDNTRRKVKYDGETYFEPSIEGTFGTLSDWKVERIARSGIQRMSLGIQSTSEDVLKANFRSGVPIAEICKWIDKIHAAGIPKVNLDFMYGIKGQSISTIEADLDAISEIKPEHITIYEFRPNQVAKIPPFSKSELWHFYNRLYDGLTNMGYSARYGQNTFTRCDGDFGMSSYLRNRMLNGCAYKGFGIAAQSMNYYGLSYNSGKLRFGKDVLEEATAAGTFESGYHYALSRQELFNKFAAISAYSGSIDLNAGQRLVNTAITFPFVNIKNYYGSEINFVINEGLMTLEGNKLFITRKGMEYYGAVFSLFYKKID